jgi:hypothetical protein
MRCKGREGGVDGPRGGGPGRALSTGFPCTVQWCNNTRDSAHETYRATVSGSRPYPIHCHWPPHPYSTARVDYNTWFVAGKDVGSNTLFVTNDYQALEAPRRLFHVVRHSSAHAHMHTSPHTRRERACAGGRHLHIQKKFSPKTRNSYPKSLVTGV